MPHRDVGGHLEEVFNVVTFDVIGDAADDSLNVELMLGFVTYLLAEKF